MQSGECICLILPEYNGMQVSNFYIDTVNAVEKKFVKLHEMGEQIKSLILLTLLQ